MRRARAASLALATLVALLPAGCKRERAQHAAAARPTPSELPFEEVALPPDAKVDLTQDRQERRRAETFAGVLPGGFPRGLPLPPQASLVDQGPRWVALLVPRAPAGVQQPYLAQLRAAGWTVEPGGDRAWTLRRAGRSVRLELRAQGPSTRLRLAY